MFQIGLVLCPSLGERVQRLQILSRQVYLNKGCVVYISLLTEAPAKAGHKNYWVGPWHESCAYIFFCTQAERFRKSYREHRKQWSESRLTLSAINRDPVSRTPALSLNVVRHSCCQPEDQFNGLATRSEKRYGKPRLECVNGRHPPSKTTGAGGHILPRTYRREVK